MKSIVIFDTALGSGNVGDEIILDAVKRNMQDVFDQFFSLRLATHVPNFSKTLLFLSKIRRNRKIEFYKKADLKFICGTNLIEQKGACRPKSQWALYPYNLGLYQNSVLIGAGTKSEDPDLSLISTYLYKRVLSKEFLHSTRDELTKQLIENLGFRAVNTGCPTIWELTPDLCERIPRKKADACILSVSGYKSQRDPVRDQAMINILKKSYKKLWIWTQTIMDEEYVRSLHGTEDMECICSLEKFRTVLRHNDADYVGTRLHGGIFALQNQVRTIIVGIDHRAEGVHMTNNIPMVSRLNVETELEDRIHSSWNTEIRNNEAEIARFKEQFYE